MLFYSKFPNKKKARCLEYYMNFGNTVKNAPEKSKVLTLANCQWMGKWHGMLPDIYLQRNSEFVIQVLYLQICFLNILKAEASSFSQWMFSYIDW